MIPLKKCNYITGDNSSVSYGLNKILNFLELEGRNIIVFYPQPKSHFNSLTYFVNNKKEYSDFNNLKSLINTEGYLFRVDLIILDIWHLKKLNMEYIDLIKSTGIDFILVSQNYHYTSLEDVCDYHIKRESNLHQNSEQFLITDKLNGWTTDLDALRVSYIRDIKINKLFDNE
jgi:hypothetical protein